MKKKIFLLFTFLISFVMFSSSVSADCKVLTCVYPNGQWGQDAVKIIQNSNCSLEFYSNALTIDANDQKWERINIESNNINFNNTVGIYANTRKKVDNSRYWDSQNEILLACPNCLDYSGGKILTHDILNKKGTGCQATGWVSDFVKLEKQIDNEAITEESIEKEEEDKINDIISQGKNYCRYYLKGDSTVTTGTIDTKTKIKIYYNDNELEAETSYSKEPPLGFKLEDFLKKGNGICPMSLYSQYSPDMGETNITLNKELATTREYVLEERKYVKETNTTIYDTDIDDPCELIGDDVLEIINNIMNVIRIAVPILLLVFGITDFFRATFTNSEDDIKKRRDTFIKRIIAAIIVFIVPIFVNLVLKLANTVWSDVFNPETCLDRKE